MSNSDFNTAFINRISAAQANRYRIIPFGESSERLLVYSDNPFPKRLIGELALILGLDLDITEQSTTWMNQALAKHYRQSNIALSSDTDFIDQLIQDAQSIGSSDIHIEPLEDRGRVRMRIDGKLMERFQISLQEYPAVINKVKVRAQLDISEKRLPQDGRISLPHLQQALDLRVSTLPVLHGEKAVMRLLGRSAGELSLQQLGMTEEQIVVYRKALSKPHGVILISGPTGSGKTTTLYATLKEISDQSRNVMTVEDPIEYTLSGISQVQVKEGIGLDFPTSLRTFLRQDPDVIMVGEIRDPQTAQMAIRASLTGHQVLSTIHTNNAWDTIMRLQDMGIAGYLVSSTLVLSVAQRLVRKVCTHCAEQEQVHDPSLFGAWAEKAPKVMAKAVGCEVCHYTGYSGRRAIYELLSMDETLAESIKKGGFSKSQAYAHAGVLSLAQQALRMVISRETTLSETHSYFIE